MKKKISNPGGGTLIEAALPGWRLLKEAEAADYLRVSTSLLAKKRCSGGGPRFCKIGRRVLYDVADLHEFAERRKRRSTSEVDAAEKSPG
jgi:hypothetical protein